MGTGISGAVAGAITAPLLDISPSTPISRVSLTVQGDPANPDAGNAVRVDTALLAATGSTVPGDRRRHAG